MDSRHSTIRGPKNRTAVDEEQAPHLDEFRIGGSAEAMHASTASCLLGSIDLEVECEKSESDEMRMTEREGRKGKAAEEGVYSSRKKGKAKTNAREGLR